MPSGQCPHPWKESWTDEELTDLRKAYSRWPIDLTPFLARHTRGGVQTKAYRLGLTRRRMVEKMFAEVTHEQWVYMAGIIDGEGTIRSQKYANGQCNRYLSFANTHRGLIDWAQQVFPGGQESENTSRPRNLPCWNVKWTRSALIAEMIDGILPYLIVKRDKAISVYAELPERFKVSAS